jgi:hypothetical protein
MRCGGANGGVNAGAFAGANAGAARPGWGYFLGVFFQQTKALMKSGALQHRISAMSVREPPENARPAQNIGCFWRRGH